MSRSMAADAENCRRGREFTKNFHIRKSRLGGHTGYIPVTLICSATPVM